MRKIFVDKIGNYVLTGDDHSHVSVVLRARVGEKLTLCCGDGYDYLCEIVGIDAKSTKLKLVDKVQVDSEPKIKIDLYAAPTKSGLDLTCQKCTELGVNAIYPFMSEFVQVKKESVKLERLNKICKEAAQQCGRGRVPVLHEPISFKDMFARLRDYKNVLFMYEKGGIELKDAIKSSGDTAIIIGSEGGFSPQEVQEFKEQGFFPISLGKRILRAETACIAAVALVMYEMGELK